MSAALLVPGQGAQTPGFLHALPDHGSVQKTLAEASAVLGRDILELDSSEALRSTVAVQLTLLTAGVAFVRFLDSEHIGLIVAAGLSVGAFTAAVAAGSIAFPDAIQFVRRRAELMESALPQGFGMGVLEGLRFTQVRDLLIGRSLTIANYNSPVQFVVSGARNEIEAILSLALAAGAHRAQFLNMPTASHTPLLGPAAQELLRFAADLPMGRSKIPVLSNSTARMLTDAEAIRQDLALNMAHPVRWDDMFTVVRGLEPRIFLEAPPGHTLTRLAQLACEETPVLCASESRWDVLVRDTQRVG
ncbi:ACP S-malonyltransferase [Granulicella arctica]|uniref:[acyl-carrier-protein] S-malonyltransferase n=1 Tax=Granulicella arctica TaxID=940613 RepID=A0A7Y9PGP4_9BACT|nr:acyltransferase domain-containing protein [Granulicella arctica]NYF79564.1 malonate decarboxylase epsilon subunit [Granulicella arctica]